MAPGKLWLWLWPKLKPLGWLGGAEKEEGGWKAGADGSCPKAAGASPAPPVGVVPRGRFRISFILSTPEGSEVSMLSALRWAMSNREILQGMR